MSKNIFFRNIGPLKINKIFKNFPNDNNKIFDIKSLDKAKKMI